MRPDNDEAGPVANRTGSNVIVGNGDDLSVVRCLCCGRTLSAPKSVELEMGPVCRVVA